MFSVAQNTISQWENGERKLDTDTLIKLSDFFGVTTDYLLGNSPDSKPSLTDLPGTTPVSGRRVKLPIIGVVRAGPGGIAYEEPIGEEWADEEDISSGKHVWFEVRGDSMSGEGIMPGDLAMVREQPEVEYGELAVVVVNGEEGTLKRVYKKADSIILQSANAKYPPRIFAGEEMNEIRIVGKVKVTKRKY